MNKHEYEITRIATAVSVILFTWILLVLICKTLFH